MMTKEEWFDTYFMPHVTAVFKYGVDLGVPKQVLATHDNSKLQEPHIDAWIAKQGGVMGTPQFYKAWLHHYRSEDHHWQHWIVYDPSNAKNVMALDMSHESILHMYADWFGASEVYGEQGNIQRFLNDNYASMILSSRTRNTLDKIIVSDGFTI